MRFQLLHTQITTYWDWEIALRFSIKDFFSKCDQVHSFLRIWSHLLEKSLVENFIFCAMLIILNFSKLSDYLL